MKSIIFSTILFVNVLVSSCIHAQTTFSRSDIEKTIKDFYIEYCNIWNNTPNSVPATLLHEKIDSLAQKYCTNQIRNDSKEWFADGHELFTNDYGIVRESLNSFSVKADSTKNNLYTITYITINPDASNKPVRQKVVLHVSVVKEKDNYKINKVK